MNHILISCLTIAAVIAASISLPTAYAFGGAVIGQPFTLKINQTMTIEPSGIQVTFANVTEDSRCPSDVQCFWAGQVSVVVNVTAQNASSLELTLSGGQSEAISFDNYLIRLVDVQPYPVSTKEISLSDYIATLVVDSSDQPIISHGVFVKAKGSGAAVVAGWNIEKGSGAVVLFLQDNPRAIIKFVPNYSDSCSQGKDISVNCIDGQVTYSSLSTQQSNIHMEIDSSEKLLYLTLPGQTDGYSMNVTKYKMSSKVIGAGNNSSIISLREGQRDGPLLVQKIFPDRIEGLNFPEYPVATDQGLPIMLRIGEKATNGCTIILTLIKIDGAIATFLKTVDEGRICPICWHQQSLTG
jgi:hypothetical protein